MKTLTEYKTAVTLNEMRLWLADSIRDQTSAKDWNFNAVWVQDAIREIIASQKMSHDMKQFQHRISHQS